MKQLISGLILTLIILSSALTAIVGLAIMGYDLYADGSNFHYGFNVFSLGAILFFVSLTTYISSKILANTNLIAETMLKLLENEISKSKPMSPLQMLFGGGFPPMGATIVSLNSERDELITKEFGDKAIKKDIHQMTLEELEAEEQIAVSTQKFELAAAIRDLMNEKKNKKS